MDFVLNFAMCSAELRERIHDPDSVMRIFYRTLPFWILNKKKKPLKHRDTTASTS